MLQASLREQGPCRGAASEVALGQLRSYWLQWCHSAGAHESVCKPLSPPPGAPCPTALWGAGRRQIPIPQLPRMPSRPYSLPALAAWHQHSGKAPGRALPNHLPDARAAASVTRTSSSARLRCMLVYVGPPASAHELTPPAGQGPPLCAVPLAAQATAPGAPKIPARQPVPAGAHDASRLRRRHVSCTASSPKQQHVLEATNPAQLLPRPCRGSHFVTPPQSRKQGANKISLGLAR